MSANLYNFEVHVELSSNFCKKYSVQNVFNLANNLLLRNIMFINITLSISDGTIDSSLNISETKVNDIVDDFDNIFNPFGIRIIYFSLWTIYVTLSNAFYALLILYEKYGEDIKKRSINNQLVSQVGLAMIVHNCVCSTIFLMRFMSGPLHSGIAVFEVFIVNIYISWGFLILAEI